jgi:hypothetical protein
MDLMSSYTISLSRQREAEERIRIQVPMIWDCDEAEGQGKIPNITPEELSLEWW